MRKDSTETREGLGWIFSQSRWCVYPVAEAGTFHYKAKHTLETGINESDGEFSEGKGYEAIAGLASCCPF